MRPSAVRHRLLLVSFLLCAGTTVAQVVDTSEITVEDRWTPTFALTLAVDFTSQYLGRGIFVENEDLIAQTALDLGVGLYQDEGAPISSFGLITGFFGSFHGGPSGSEGPSDDAFNEADGYVGFSLGLFSEFELALAYYKYTSPNDSFEDIDEFDIGIAWDD